MIHTRKETADFTVAVAKSLVTFNKICFNCGAVSLAGFIDTIDQILFHVDACNEERIMRHAN